MSPAEPLDLRDIHLPADPGWWPPAPGWWLLAALLLVGLVFALRWFIARMRVRGWRKRLLRELDALVAADAREPARLAGGVSQLLRRIMLRLDPSTAALRGEAWLDHLDRRWPAQDRAAGSFRAQAAWLNNAAYRRPGDPALRDLDADALLAVVRSRLDRAAEELARA